MTPQEPNDTAPTPEMIGPFPVRADPKLRPGEIMILDAKAQTDRGVSS